MTVETVGYGLAFLAGLVSFVSPCCLPLVPTYVTYLAGTSYDELVSDPARLKNRILANAAAFVLGFSLVFILLGAGASVIGQALRANMSLLRQVSALVVVGFGLHMMGFLRLPFLEREMRVGAGALPGAAAGIPRSLLMGAAFSAGWSPCIGPILASILFLASQAGTAAAGAGLLAVYSAGLALPFLAVAVSMRWFLGLLPRLGRTMAAVRTASGALLVGVGLMIYFNVFTVLNRWFNVNQWLGL